jgi:hypothetical protein
MEKEENNDLEMNDIAFYLMMIFTVASGVMAFISEDDLRTIWVIITFIFIDLGTLIKISKE